MSMENQPEHDTGFYQQGPSIHYTGDDIKTGMDFIAETQRRHAEKVAAGGWLGDLRRWAKGIMGDPGGDAKRATQSKRQQRKWIKGFRDHPERHRQQGAAARVLAELDGIEKAVKAGDIHAAVWHAFQAGIQTDRARVIPAESRLWLRIGEAAKVAGCGKEYICRDAGPGGSGKPIIDNGRTWARRRVRLDSLTAWILARHDERDADENQGPDLEELERIRAHKIMRGG